MDVILHHGACPDGWAAAFIAKLKYPEAELKPLNHGEQPEKINALIDSLTGKDVLMLDFSFRTREENDRLASVAKSFRILDHHKTAQAVLEGAAYAIFDMNRSGAGLSWDYLFGINSPDVQRSEQNPEFWKPPFILERPWWVDYVEARDLWRWDSLPDSREICAYLGTLPFEFEAWANLKLIDEEQAKKLGKGALAHIEHFVRETVKNVRPGIFKNGEVVPGVFQGYGVNILNATYLNCSEIGNELAKTAAFSITWFERNDDIIQFSLRSIGEFDVSAIAKQFKGGGHKNAAGFQLSIKDGRDLIDRIVGRPTSGQSLVTEMFGSKEENLGRCI